MKSKSSFSKIEADKIVGLIQEKLKASSDKQKGIRDKIRKLGFFASDYGFRNGYTVEQFLSVARIEGDKPIGTSKALDSKNTRLVKPASINKGRSQSDESYIIDLCDEVLVQKALRQHRFAFLKGDAGTRLPVDAYYPDLNLVIEFRERQHTEEVGFFDKRMTYSGKSRGEQRKAYDQLRRVVLPRHGILLIEFDYSAFAHLANKKLVRKKAEDMEIIREKLNKGENKVLRGAEKG